MMSSKIVELFIFERNFCYTPFFNKRRHEANNEERPNSDYHENLINTKLVPASHNQPW